MELETGRTMDSSTSFAVGERVFHVVTEALTVRSTTGRILSVFVSPIALLVVEPHDRYVVSLTDDDLTSLISLRKGLFVYDIRKATTIGSRLTPSSALTEPSSLALSRSGWRERDVFGRRSRAQATDHRYPAKTAVSAGSPTPKATSAESLLTCTALRKPLRTRTIDGAASISRERIRSILDRSNPADFSFTSAFRLPGLLRHRVMPNQRRTMLLFVRVPALDASTMSLNGISRTAATIARSMKRTIARTSRSKCGRPFPG